MVVKIRFLILLGITLVYGIAWSFIYILFSAFHGMTRMFNEEFIFLIANLLNVELNSVTSGLIFAFLDGALFGSLFRIMLLIIHRKNPNK